MKPMEAGEPGQPGKPTKPAAHPESEIVLRDVTVEDLPILFEHQRDPVATRMSAVASRDRAGFTAHWNRILSDATIDKQAIVCDGRLVGYLVCFERMNRMEIGYWVERGSWNRGIATRALSMFLRHVKRRPLYGRVVKDNAASVRVLEKCGFEITGEEREFLPARGEVVEGYILMLGPERSTPNAPNEPNASSPSTDPFPR